MRDAKSARYIPLGHRPVRTTPSSSCSSGQTRDHEKLWNIAHRYNPRSWKPIAEKGQQTLRVMTYNLLANSLAQGEPKFQNGHVPDPREWTERRKQLLQEIGAAQAEVICVQELDESDHEGHFGKTLRGNGYQSVFKKRRSDMKYGFAIFHQNDRTTLVRECPIPCPQREVVRGIEDAGVMLVLDVAEVLTGDFNASPDSHLIKYVLEGSANFAQMPAEDFSSPAHTVSWNVGSGHLEMVGRFKTETLNLRDAVKAPTYATSEEGHWSMIKGYWEDMDDPVVDHTLHLSSVYDLGNAVDYIFHGAVMGYPRLEVVSRLELPERLARLKAGLPAAHFGSDHFALAAEFRFADEVDGLDEVEEEMGGVLEEVEVEVVKEGETMAQALSI
ncbi:hypothetical protein BGZ72_001673, partial [Mortierella alpina]